MSSGYWQTERQREQYSNGKTATQRVSDYVQTWKTRAYFDDIPDTIPAGLERCGRVPHYKAIAMAILRNDLNFHSLGFARSESGLTEMLMHTAKSRHSSQLDLFTQAGRRNA